MVAAVQHRKLTAGSGGVALLFLLLTLVTANPARAQEITLNLVNVDIETAVRTIAQATGREVVVDSRVKGTITLQFERPLSRARAWEAIQAQLRLAGYSMTEAGGVWRVIPEIEAKLQGGPVVRAARYPALPIKSLRRCSACSMSKPPIC